MKTKAHISALLILTLLGCKVAMQEGVELMNSSYAVIELDGKSLWLIYRDSLGNDYEDANGIHKIKYSTYRFLNRRTMATEYFDLQDNYLDTSSVLEYAKAIEKWRKDGLIEQCFMDCNENLVQPSYLNYAKLKQRNYRDGSWKEKYFDMDNEPICNNGISEQRMVWDTIWQISMLDTSYLLRIKLLDSKKCKLK